MILFTKTRKTSKPRQAVALSRIALAPLSILLSVLTLAPVAAPAQQPVAPATVSGTVLDPDAELIPGATITLSAGPGKQTVVQSGSDGTYKIKVPAGTYTMTVTMPGFAAYIRQGLQLTAGQALAMNAKLALQDEKTVVEVNATPNTVSVDPESNASAVVIKGEALDALSDDPDELSSELQALAGPTAGPNGGQIYIDGFTGGQLPPKSSIREIRINQNPFSAQYDQLGFGRIEIFTKPGTDKFHGSAQINGYDNDFNTGNPILGPAAIQPYHTIFFFGNLTGPINHFASFALGGSRRAIQDNTVIDPNEIYAHTATPGVYCQPGDTTCQTITNFTAAELTPSTRWDVSPRLDLAIGEKNTLTTRFSYTSNSQQNQGIGGNDLASTGYNSQSTEDTVQISDTQILSEKVINETRFEYQRTPSTQTPFSTAPTLNVQGSFVGGGVGSGASNVTDHHIELQNYTSVQLKKNFLRLGGRLRTTQEDNTSHAGANGTFNYTSSGNTTAIQNYINGVVGQFTISQIANPTVRARNLDAGFYAETDWKPRPNLTVSYGIRFETQNFIHDKSDWAPRVSFAYGVTKKTVLRGGFGIFYTRFGLGSEVGVDRNNGVNVVNVLDESPSAACSPNSAAGIAACTSGAVKGQTTTYTVSPTLHAPYTLQSAFGVDQQLFKGAKISVNYLNARGARQFLSQNETFLQSGPTTSAPLVYQYQSEGDFRQNQINTSISYSGYRNISLFGYYSLNYANSDTNGAGNFPSNPYNPNQDYGRASYDVRHRVVFGGSVPFPHSISASPFLIAQSGNPYDLTTGSVDLNGDAQTNNERVAFATPGSANSKTIAGCGTFTAPSTAPYTEIPAFYCTGPSNFTMNLRLTKTFGFGPLTAAGQARRQRQQQGGPPSGFGMGGGPGGGPGGGGGRGGGPGGGGPGGGGTNTGHRYNLTIGAQGSNIFNVADRGTPVGTFTSPDFGRSTQLAGGIFTTNSSVRRVLLQASFTF